MFTKIKRTFNIFSYYFFNKNYLFFKQARKGSQSNNKIIKKRKTHKATTTFLLLLINPYIYNISSENILFVHIFVVFFCVPVKFTKDL